VLSFGFPTCFIDIAGSMAATSILPAQKHPLRPDLVPLAREDRVNALRVLLSQDARNFLARIRAQWGSALFAN
jgi:hypothetical protein